MEPAEFATYDQYVAPFVSPDLREELPWEMVEAQSMIALATLEGDLGTSLVYSPPHRSEFGFQAVSVWTACLKNRLLYPW